MLNSNQKATSMMIMGLLTILLLGLSSCKLASEALHKAVAPKIHNYEESSSAIESCNFDKLIEVTSTNQNELLKNAELGLAYYLKQDYQNSNNHLTKAINLYQANENRAIISLSNIVRNEYQAEGFDKVFLHNYKAINYLMLGELEASRVESKNANLIQQQEKLKLQKIQEKYNKKNKNHHIISRYERLFNQVNPKHNPYQNPFAYYISALGYAQEGDYDNALIDIRNAIKFNSETSLLKNKLLTYQKGTSLTSIELFFDIGQSPLKSQLKVEMEMGNGEKRVAYLPNYTISQSDVHYVKVINSKNQEVTRSSLLSDINAIKVNEFQEKLPAILSLITKEASLSVGSKVLDEKSKLLATLFKTSSAIYGQNDISTWSSLPQKILVASFVPKKDETYQIEIISTKGSVLDRVPLIISSKGNRYRHYLIRKTTICK